MAAIGSSTGSGSSAGTVSAGGITGASSGIDSAFISASFSISTVLGRSWARISLCFFLTRSVQCLRCCIVTSERSDSQLLRYSRCWYSSRRLRSKASPHCEHCRIAVSLVVCWQFGHFTRHLTVLFQPVSTSLLHNRAWNTIIVLQPQHVKSGLPKPDSKVPKPAIFLKGSAGAKPRREQRKRADLLQHHTASGRDCELKPSFMDG